MNCSLFSEIQISKSELKPINEYLINTSSDSQLRTNMRGKKERLAFGFQLLLILSMPGSSLEPQFFAFKMGTIAALPFS